MSVTLVSITITLSVEMNPAAGMAAHKWLFTSVDTDMGF
jgi:hypothetical protein